MYHAHELAKRLATQIGQIEGVRAVVLGGSWARGDAQPNSDIDLGIYYDPQQPLSIAKLRELAHELDDNQGAESVTEIGGWGPWINGGAWLRIEGQRVDWIYRDIEQVTQTIHDCRAGLVTCHYQPGHPHGFHNHMYMGEVFYCQSLHDPDNVLTRLKALTTPYPPQLKHALIDSYLWQADFALGTSHTSAERDDVYYVVGNLFRCVACLVQVLYGLNERYFINEKGSVKAVASFPLHPANFNHVVSQVLAAPGTKAAELRSNIQHLTSLVHSVRALCENIRT